jgi:single-strand DNA-binding protein
VNYNRVILVGRITQDPEMKATTGGAEVVNFSLAVNRYSKDQQQADFFRIVCFGKNAEFVKSYVKKGRLLLVEGSLRNNSWQDRDGNKRITTEIIANRVQPLEKRTEEPGEVPPEDLQSGNLPSEDDGLASGNGDSDEVPF